MTEFCVEKPTLRLEATSFITGTSGISFQSWLCNELMKFALISWRVSLLPTQPHFRHAIYIRRAHQPRLQGPVNEATSLHAFISRLIDHLTSLPDLLWEKNYRSLFLLQNVVFL